MFVLLDMEWIEGRDGHRSLTQLYAARVDEKWNTIRAFDALVCPRDSVTSPWEHLAFNGYAPAEFCASDSEKDCVQRFFRWLQPDDVICCWHVETKNTLKALYRRYLFGTFSTTVRGKQRNSAAEGCAVFSRPKDARRRFILSSD